MVFFNIYNLYIFVIGVIIYSFYKYYEYTNNKFVYNIELNNNQYNNTEFNLEKIIGLESVKKELKYFIDFIINKKKYLEKNVKTPKGVLLIGPPGTGKTLLVKTMAKNINIPVIYTSGSQFIEKYVGVGASRIRELFVKARNLAIKHKGCIIFIDEIDSIGKNRNSDSSNVEYDSTLNQLLTEFDGFNNLDNILIFGATNHSEILDSALTRSGRFDKKIYFDPPNKTERKELFKLYLYDEIEKYRLNNIYKQEDKPEDKPEDKSEDKTEDKLEDKLEKYFKYKEIKKQTNDELDILAELTSGLTGADISSICNQSKINAIIEDSEDIKLDLIKKAIDEVIVGREKPERKLDKEELKRVSIHEAGHAILSYYLKNVSSPLKVSILPRGQYALGFSQSKPDELKLQTNIQIEQQISVFLGGTIAEEIMLNSVSSGAYDDIEKATKLAMRYFKEYGMDNNSGPINYKLLYKYEDNKEINEKIINFIKEIKNKTKELLEKEEMKNNIIKISELLLEKETIIYEDLKNLIDINNNNISNKIKENSI